MSGTEYYFIDYENVAVQAIPEHAGVKQVLLFAGGKQTKVTLDIAETLQKLGTKAKIVRMQGEGGNALDFHIAFYLGRYAQLDPEAVFRIVSKDKGFDPLVRHLVAEGIDCARSESLAVKQVSAEEAGALIAGLGPHLRALSEKARPKKAARLKAYIKHHLQAEDALVDRLFADLIAEGAIGLDGTKVKYPPPIRRPDEVRPVGPSRDLEGFGGA